MASPRKDTVGDAREKIVDESFEKRTTNDSHYALKACRTRAYCAGMWTHNRSEAQRASICAICSPSTLNSTIVSVAFCVRAAV
jgi:hypothetical protein